MENSQLSDNLKELMAIDHEDEESGVIKKAPFGWPGGKSRSIPFLLPHLPVRDSYIEECGGSGIVLLNRPRSKLEVFNDRFSGVTDFYRCIQNRKLQEELANRLEFFIHSKEMFIWARDSWKDCEDKIERAARWFYTVRTSFGSIGEHWGRAIDSNGMIGPKLRESIKGFKKVHYRIWDVQLENLDAIDCLRQYDNRGAVHYIDPDYMDSALHYEHRMDRTYHCKLLKEIFEGKGFFAISGYPNNLYSTYDWTDIYQWDVPLTASGDGDTRQYAKETLWIKDQTL